MTDQRLWTEIQKRITRRKSRKVSMKDLRDRLCAEKESPDKACVVQLEFVVQEKIESGELRHANGYMFLPDAPPPFAAELPAGRKKKTKLDPRQEGLFE